MSLLDCEIMLGLNGIDLISRSILAVEFVVCRIWDLGSGIWDLGFGGASMVKSESL